MKGKLINFNKARIMAYMRRYEKTGVVHHGLSRIVSGGGSYQIKEFPLYYRVLQDIKRDESIKRQYELFKFDEDLEVLKNNFKTDSSKFMFPTVLCKYRRGMNPVRALYYELQKTLFQFDSKNAVHLWVIGLFSDGEWYDDLINSLEVDYRSISKFQQKYMPAGAAEEHIERRISVLTNVKENLLHFREVFILMNGNEDRYLK